MSENSLSPVEHIKRNSHGLRGTLGEGLKNQVTGSVSDDDQNLVKFHGMYQQDDRDRRDERAAKKLERLYSFMIRLRLPGGFMKPEQWLATHEIAGLHSTGVIKITTRQTLQLHGILKSHLRPTIQAFSQAALDSIATCGDVNRNIACSSHPGASPLHAEIFAYAGAISQALLPKTGAYHEIWIDDEKVGEKEYENEADPLYQDRYLPRKFKIGILIPPNNDVDVLTNDLALIAIIENNELLGFNVAVGGGLSSTHGNPQHYARLASVIGFVPKGEDLMKVVYEVLTVQRDWGNRSDRKRARLKYTVDERGLEAFRDEVSKRAGVLIEPERPWTVDQRVDLYGWEQNYEGRWYYTVFVENGRVLDDDQVALKSALYEVAATGKANFRFTSNQNVILSDIADADKEVIAAILERYKITEHTERATALRKNAMACVALPTCPLALAEAQRYMPSLISAIEPLLAKHGLEREPIIMRMTGCPNGCGRSANAEIGFIGTAPGRYNLMLGGDHVGLRLNSLYKSSLNEEEILNELDGLFEAFSRERSEGESFGDFTHRMGQEVVA